MQAECAPPEVRGALVGKMLMVEIIQTSEICADHYALIGLQQLAITTGIMISFWIGKSSSMPILTLPN